MIMQTPSSTSHRATRAVFGEAFRVLRADGRLAGRRSWRLLRRRAQVGATTLPYVAVAHQSLLVAIRDASLARGERAQL